MDYLEYKNYLAHHGILGMHWGIRRYQNKDGSYTAEGKKRYFSGGYIPTLGENRIKGAQYVYNRYLTKNKKDLNESGKHEYLTESNEQYSSERRNNRVRKREDKVNAATVALMYLGNTVANATVPGYSNIFDGFGLVYTGERMVNAFDVGRKFSGKAIRDFEQGGYDILVTQGIIDKEGHYLKNGNIKKKKRAR